MTGVSSERPDLGSELSADQRSLLAGVPTDLLLDGWQPAEGGRRFAVEDPARGEVIAEVADAGPADALRALELAAGSAVAWAATAPRRRADLLMKAYAVVIGRREAFAQLITLEMGKPLSEARDEVVYAADYLRWYAEQAVRFPGRMGPSPDGRSTILVSREPVGVCLLITPWNYPLAMAARKIAPALAAGCTAILKPADLTPLTSLLLGQVLLDAGVPAGVCTIIPTTDADAVSRTLMSDPRLAKVSFTGSTQVGRLLLERSAVNVMRASMELGGNAPLLVFNDADINAAVDGAVLAKLRNGGQSCTAANRIFVQDGVADTFIERFTARLAAVTVGRGTVPGVTVGPLINAAAVAKARRLVDDALERGARLLLGETPRAQTSGYFHGPVVLEVEDERTELLHEEVFAPVATIKRFASEEEALMLANATGYGLAGYVFTDSVERAARVTAGLHTGMIGLNRGLVSDVAAPFGGVGLSGLGREGGSEGLEEYLNIKYVAHNAPRPVAARQPD
jgi:succinate-semialdehyde dehydrogenase/glutarate-semialdehyde dehydrogenase